MSDQLGPGGLGPDDRQAERWIADLRDGSSDEKAAARRGLAAHFEARGLASEATDLLVANAREGYRDVELFQALARLYRAQGNEYLAASAALEATRLSGRRPAPGRAAGRAEAVHDGPVSSRTPWGEVDRPQPNGTGAEGQRARAAPAESEHAGVGPDVHAAWRRPTRIVGWLAVVVTLFAALGVSSTSVVSAGIYLGSAAALGMLLSGNQSARHLLRLPAGPLGDGALLFAWLLLLLVAGAILPRGPGFVGAFSQPTTAVPTPSLYRTPVSPTPSPQATPTAGP